MPKPRAVAAALLIAALVAFEPQPHTLGAQARGGLTEVGRLTAAYDTILQARFAEARAQLNAACPPAPVAACDALREVAVWWEIQQDPWSDRLDADLQRAAVIAIASAEAWTRREPTSGEAWFYLAAAHAPLSQWRVFRGERLAAARDGKGIKEALERALALDPTLQDAWFGIGLYHYYAGVAPAALKLLRFLLMLPGGDRNQGLAEMNRARAGGQLLRGEADYQMHWIYVWYEEQPARARDLIRELDARYPSNPLFLQRLADIEHVHFSDHAASAAAWQQLRDRAAGNRVTFTALADTRAQVGLAAEWIDLGTPARAIEPLRALIRTQPATPHGVLALASITLGDAYMALGTRAAAATAYADALRSAPQSDPEALRARAQAGLSRARSRR